MRELSIHRVFDAPRELVFRAWTRPEHLTQWYGPVGTHTPLDTISVDVRAGGTWRACMINNETGEEYPTGGEFREVVEPERLVFTWGEPGGTAVGLVTVTFEDLGAKTAMNFLLTELPDDPGLFRGVSEGWSSAFDRLTELLEGR
ncbi:SRPBCC family protein [Actinocrispum sp. NPDC049592]|uniref:SRPBCC family protein n=1 Tax=Actinocrispum sp. NPDC049592 TaxID=3154835 RepID=UPI00342B1E37